MNIVNNPIGVFDSGVGGLSVLKKLRQELPFENYLYFGDTARIPYGEKSKNELFQMGREILDWFKSQNVKSVIMACNTSSAVVLEKLQKEYSFPMFGLIQPTAEFIAYSEAKKVGVMATTATVNSKAYSKEIHKLNPAIEVAEQACPGLVELIENGKAESFEAKTLVISYIMPFVENNFDRIILGCTHYPYLRKVLETFMLSTETLIDPALHLAKKVSIDLTMLGILNFSSKAGKVDYFVSANPEKFEKAGLYFYKEVRDVRKISLFNQVY